MFFWFFKPFIYLCLFHLIVWMLPHLSDIFFSSYPAELVAELPYSSILIKILIFVKYILTWVKKEVCAVKSWKAQEPQEHFIIHFIVLTKHVVVLVFVVFLCFLLLFLLVLYFEFSATISIIVTYLSTMCSAVFFSHFTSSKHKNFIINDNYHLY